MKLFKTADEKLADLGFVPNVHEYSNPKLFAGYTRYNKEFNYTQSLDFCHKKDREPIVQSFQYLYDENGKVKDECYVVGLTKTELKVCSQKLKELRW